LAEFRVRDAALLFLAEIETDKFAIQVKGNFLMKCSLFHDINEIICKKLTLITKKLLQEVKVYLTERHMARSIRIK